MQFSEIIDSSGVEKVSSITNISIDNLNFLVNEDFEKLTRVKALGFLLILEREYKEADVSSLRERVKTYFDEHKPLDENVVMVSKDSVSGGGFSFFKWFIILALIGGGWYLYSEGKLDGVLQNISDKKDSFTDKKALENNVTDAEAEKVSIQKESSKVDAQEIVAIATPIEPSEKKITLIRDDSKVDLNSTELLQNKEQNSQNNDASTVATALNSVNEAKVLSEAEKSTESVIQEVVESAEVVVEKTLESVVSESNETVTPPVTAISTITINPTRGTLWFGFINIDTKKRREFMKKVSTPFDIKGGRWLLVTGHGYVDIVSDLKTVELTDSRKHYFYIDSSEIRTLTKKEFRSMNGRRGW